MPDAIAITRCPLCGGDSLTPRPPPQRTVGGAFAGGGFGLARCRGCGFEFTAPRPSAAALAGFYQAHDYTAHEPVDDVAALARAELQLATVERARLTVRGARILDVGCGGGHLLARARARGATPCGVDPAAHAHAACARLGLPVVADLAALAGRRFDGVVVSHVLEHVPDPGTTLADLHDLLEPGGWLCVEVPNLASLRARLSVAPLIARGADERYRAFPIHLSYFTPATLARALTDAGFTIVARTTTGLGLGALRPRRAPPPPSPARPSNAAPPASAPPSAPLPRHAARLYTAVRGAFHRALLGENLIAVAVRAGG